MQENGKSAPVQSCNGMRAGLQGGQALRVRFEDVEPQDTHNDSATALALALERGMQSLFNTRTTVHLYHQTRGDSQALAPHADPYDVVVV